MTRYLLKACGHTLGYWSAKERDNAAKRLTDAKAKVETWEYVL